MRRVYRALLPLCLAGVSGCAFLVSYDGFRDGDGGSVDGSDDASDELADRDASGNDGAADAGPDTRGTGCLTVVVTGYYCGRAVPDYKGNPDDRLFCLGDGGTGFVEPCAAGCVAMPAGRPDMCNRCAERTDGVYCAHILDSTYAPKDVILRCNAGRSLDAAVCPTVCSPSGAAATCM
jgi:hypothetical protein